MRASSSTQGADILDIGGESTRPGARAGVRRRKSWSALLPVLEGLRDVAVPISVDTSKPEVMRRGAGGAVRA